MFPTGLGIIAVIALVLLNGFFVAAEFALVSVRRTRIEQLVSDGSSRAVLVREAINHLDTYIAATQLGITMASLALGFVGEPAIAGLIEPLFETFLHGEEAVITSHAVALILAFALATSLHIVFGELAPKSIALQKTESVALWVARPLNLFLKVFRPFILALNKVGNASVRLIGMQPATEQGVSIHSVEELELLVHSTREAGLLVEQQERMVSGVFDFRERRANQIMIPRTELDSVPVTISFRNLMEKAANGPHNRLPVYEENLDRVLGVIHSKDLLRLLSSHDYDPDRFDIRSIIRPVAFVPESSTLDALVVQLRTQNAQVAIVVDEFGGTAGLVTLEDLLEEIIGEVADEFATGEHPDAERLPDGSLALSGLLSIEEANEQFGLDLDATHYETIGGYVFGKLGKAPSIGDEVRLGGGRKIRVAELDGLRVSRVVIGANALAGSVTGEER